MTQLARCPHCQRHLRLTETVCPFCEGSVEGRLTPKQTKPLQTRGLSRAGILALGASLAAAGALEGCAEEPDPEPEDEGNQVPIYGAPVQNDGSIAPMTSADAGVRDAGTSNDAAASDSGTVMAIYGAPVQLKDSGVVAVPVYGAPIQPDAGNPDAGPADAGRLVPVYGAPVPVYGAPPQPSIKAEED
jgi:hypothetical protein